jgi:hypothetical protein
VKSWIRIRIHNTALNTKKIILPIRFRQQDADPTGTIDNWAPDPDRSRDTASQSILYLDGDDVLLDVVVGEPVPQLEPGGAQVTLVRVILRVNRLQKERK